MPRHALIVVEFRRLPFQTLQSDSVHCAALSPPSPAGFRRRDFLHPCAHFGREKGARGRLRRHPLIGPIFSLHCPRSRIAGLLS
jgi:hypothetical protein